MSSREAGRTPLPLIMRELALSQRQIGRVKEELRKFSSNLAVALREIGVTYLVTGKGRGSKSFLVKTA